MASRALRGGWKHVCVCVMIDHLKRWRWFGIPWNLGGNVVCLCTLQYTLSFCSRSSLFIVKRHSRTFQESVNVSVTTIRV